MSDKELAERTYQFLSDNMGAFVNYPTDIGELNEIMMELERRKRSYK